MKKTFDYTTNRFLARMAGDSAPPSDLLRCPAEEMETVRRFGRERLSEILGIDRFSRYRIPLRFEMDRQWRGEYGTIEKYAVSGLSDLDFPIYVLRPQDRAVSCSKGASGAGGREKTVLYLHGHDDLGVMGALIKRDDKIRYHKMLPLLLQERGYTVAAPELAGFGETGGGCFQNASQLLLCGLPLAGLRTVQAQTAIDFIGEAGLPQDITLFGVSGGGLTAAMLHALERRHERTILAAYANTYQGSILKKEHCIENYIPGILTVGDSWQILSLGAPRPLFAVNGRYDRGFSIEGSETAFAGLKQVYERMGAKENFKGTIFEGKHEICAEEVLGWLDGQDRCDCSGKTSRGTMTCEQDRTVPSDR